MKKVIIDTNFLLACVSQKIDFFHDIKVMGIKILIPKQVINELHRIQKSSKKLKFKDASALALKILEANKEDYRIIDLSKYGQNTDKGIKNYSNKNSEVIVATLDRGIKRNVLRHKMVIRNRKKLEIV